jgi:hypothetical protein
VFAGAAYWTREAVAKHLAAALGRLYVRMV